MTTKMLIDVCTGIGPNNNYYDWRGMQEAFVSIIKWLDTLTDIGITRVASYYGAAQSNLQGVGSMTGTAFDYWDRQASCGTNAWCLYRWGNASVPFYMLIQWSPGTAIMTTGWGATGGLAYFDSNAAGGIGVQFAFRADGTSPWNGTTNNNGADTKGNPLWKPTSNAVQDLYVFPRANSIRGSYFTSKQYFMILLHFQDSQDTSIPFRHRVHSVVDENNVFFCSDYKAGGNEDLLYFGKFTPVNDVYYATSGSAYWCYASIADPVAAGAGVGNVHGPTSPNSSFEGGIQHPNPASGTIGYCWDIPAPAYNWSGLNNAQNCFYMSSSQFARYDECPILLYMNEQAVSMSGTMGLLGFTGQSDFLRWIGYGLQVHTTLNGRTRMSWGTYYPGSPKFTTPWVTGTLPPYQGYDRVGFYYSG